MKIVVSSDWHLDEYTAGVPRWDDVAAAVEEVLEAVESADAFMFLGDLSDPDSLDAHRAAAFAIEAALAISEMDKPSLWLVGNHDVIEDGTGTSVLSPLAAAGVANCEVASGPGLYELHGLGVGVRRSVLVMALPYVERSAWYDPVEFISRACRFPDIVAGHVSIPGITPGSETTRMPRGKEAPAFPIEECRQQWPDAVLLNGHYHERQTFRGINIPGSLVRLHFDEEANRPGYLVLEL